MDLGPSLGSKSWGSGTDVFEWGPGLKAGRVLPVRSKRESRQGSGERSHTHKLNNESITLFVRYDINNTVRPTTKQSSEQDRRGTESAQLPR